MIQEALRKLALRDSLTYDEATEVAQTIMDGEATPAQIGALLVALRLKGETVEEATAFAKALRARVVPVHPKRKPLLDTCGTGGSTVKTFNVSTTSAFVLAGAGIAVAKHGNRAMSGVCGSADVLEALGVRLDLSPEQLADCEIGIRTLFNLLGPLTNPAGATLQVMGVYDSALCPLAIGTLRELGAERALVLHGAVGMVEVSTVGETCYAELRDGNITEGVLSPEDFGLSPPPPNLEDLAPAPTPAENANLLRDILRGKQATPQDIARRNIIAVNAAVALVITGLAKDWRDGYQQAIQVIDSGKALERLERLVAFTQSVDT
ncbi:MAG: anthranilate phosphoribosyltransferase [Armatimonadetes bacterium]|nr:anthranilate phosphoribosyltransferase [Armatimonadota bacterium]